MRLSFSIVMLSMLLYSCNSFQFVRTCTTGIIHTRSRSPHAHAHAQWSNILRINKYNNDNNRLYSLADEKDSSVLKKSSVDAEQLMKKAKKLRSEADREEIVLQEEKRMANIKKYGPADKFIQEMRQILGHDKSSIDGKIKLVLSPREQEDRDRRFIYDRLKSNLPSQDTLLLVVERLFENREEFLRKYREAEKVKQSQPSTSSQDFIIGDVLNSKENRLAKANAEISESEVEAMRCSLLWEYIISAIEAIASEDETKFGISLDGDVFKVNDSSDVIAYRNQRPGVDVTAMAKELRSREKDLTLKSMANAARRVVTSLSDSKTDNSKTENNGYESYIQDTYGLMSVPGVDGSKDFNATRDALVDLISLPRWVPNSLGGLLVTTGKKLNKEDIVQLQEDVLDGSSFYVTSKDASNLAAIFRGNLLTERDFMREEAKRKSTPSSAIRHMTRNDTAFTNILRRLELAPNNLSDRVQLFFFEDQEPREEYGRFKNYQPQKVIIAVSKSVQPEQGELRGTARVALTVASVLLTVLLTFSYAIITFALNENLFDASVNDLRLVLIKDISSIMLGIWGIQSLHEVAHMIVAKARGIRIGLPVPIPSLQFGTFGAITPLRSFPRDRLALFDFSVSGPLVAFLVSFTLYAVGLSLTVNASSNMLSLFPAVPAVLFKSSCLIGTLTSVVAPKIMLMPLAQPVPIHPLCCIAEVGLYISALNSLPLGRTDGGRMSTSIFGPKSASLLTFVSLALLSIICLTGKSIVLLFWGLFVTLFQRAPEIPTRDSVTDLDSQRIILYLGILVFSVLTLIPFPGGSAL